MQVPGPFEYERATSVDHAIGLLQQLGPQARVLAGGHSLLPMMKLRLTDVEHVVDLNDLHGELGYVRVGADEVRIGAMTRHRELLEAVELAALFPIFADAERVIADPPVRNRGTIGGSLGQADPAEDLSAVCTALDARCVVRGPSGERVLAMHELHRGPYETALSHDELITEIRIPVRPHGSSAYAKVERRAGDWAICSVGAAVWFDGPVVADVRVALAAVGPSSDGIPAIAEQARGREPDEELYAEAGAIAARSCSPTADARGSVDYKRHLADELTRRTLRRAVQRARAGRAGDRAGAEGGA